MKKRYKGKWWNKKGKWIFIRNKCTNNDMICHFYYQFGTKKTTTWVYEPLSEEYWKEYWDKYAFDVRALKEGEKN